jgi:hypothetical protein
MQGKLGKGLQTGSSARLKRNFKEKLRKREKTHSSGLKQETRQGKLGSIHQFSKLQNPHLNMCNRKSLSQAFQICLPFVCIYPTRQDIHPQSLFFSGQSEPRIPSKPPQTMATRTHQDGKCLSVGRVRGLLNSLRTAHVGAICAEPFRRL